MLLPSLFERKQSMILKYIFLCFVCYAYFSYVSVNHKNCNLHSFTQRCPELCSAWISAVCDFSQLDSGLSPTFLSLTQRCPRQCSVDSALSPALFSFMQRYPGQRSVYTQHCTYLTQRCPGHCSAWFSAVLEIVKLLPVTYFCLISKEKN